MKLFDLHCDTLLGCERSGVGLRQNDMAVSFASAAELEKYIQLFAVFFPEGMEDAEAVAHYDRLTALLRAELEKNADIAHPVYDLKDLTRTEPRIGAVLSVEGGWQMCSDEGIERMAEDGVKVLSFAWNSPTPLGDGVNGKDGLTARGKEAARRMWEKGIVLDVSHLCDAAFWDAASLDLPIIATHSNARAVCGHPRNLTDEQIRCLRDRGGLIGLNLLFAFISEKPWEEVSFDEIYAQCVHFWELGCEDVFCMGSDYDGARLPAGLGRVGDIRKLEEYLLSRGVSQQLADKFFFQNACDYFTRLR